MTLTAAQTYTQRGDPPGCWMSSRWNWMPTVKRAAAADPSPTGASPVILARSERPHRVVELITNHRMTRGDIEFLSEAE